VAPDHLTPNLTPWEATNVHGPATYSATVTSLGPLSGSCQSVTAVVSIRLKSGTGSLSLSANGTICYPGNSHNAPGSQHSFGNPLRVHATYTVLSGTGVFAGANGSGTATVKAAGAHSALTAHGTLGF